MSRTVDRILILVSLPILAYVSTFGQADKFPYKQADMPFHAIAKRRDIDKKCPATGYVKPNTKGFDAKQQQNEAKNNFAAAGTPVAITITDFDRLERATLKARNCWAKKRSGCHKVELTSSMLPADRTQLHDIATTAKGVTIGEGTLVVLEAKLVESHYSNTKFNTYGGGETGSGESVNCGDMPAFDATAIDSNDIHVVLGASSKIQKCMSVTAEVSPHYRPEAWRRFHNMSGPINDEAPRVSFKTVEMVRLTGPLFYDASHDPCTPTKKSSPARRSIWEIHPLYGIEVKVGGQWQKFEDWVTNP